MNPSYWPRLEPEIRRLAGTMTAHEMAKRLGVTYASLTTGACRRKISLAVPGLLEMTRIENMRQGAATMKARAKPKKVRKSIPIIKRRTISIVDALWKPTTIGATQ